jgi:hypothetical protein
MPSLACDQHEKMLCAHVALLISAVCGAALKKQNGQLKRGTSNYDHVKQQIISGQWDVSGKLPHRAILDFNIEVGNWPESKYKYAPFSTSVRSLVNKLCTSGKIPSQGETEGQGK